MASGKRSSPGTQMGRNRQRLDVLFRHADGDGLGSANLAANRTVFGYVFAYSSRGLRLPTLRRN